MSKPSLYPATLFSDAVKDAGDRDIIGTIVAVSADGQTARVKMPGGDVLSRVPLAGGGRIGDPVRLRYSNGRYVALGGGEASSGGAGGAGAVGVVVVGGGTSSGAPSPHDLLGVHHTLPTLSAGLFLASPAASGGAPSFRALVPSDIPAMTAPFLTTALDATLPNERALVVSGLGLSANDGLAGGNFTIALASSSNPGAAAAIMATDASGYFTGVRITLTDRLRAPTLDTASGSMAIQPATDLFLSPASNLVKLSSGKSLQSDNYASQLTGMRITHSGQGDFRYLYTDEMHVKSFMADLEQALAGGQIITPSVTLLYANFTVPNAGASATFIVRDLPSATGMQVFPNRDIARFRSFSRSAGSLTIGDAWGEVVLDTTYGTSGFDSATKTQRYTLYRYAGLTIADTTNDPITDTTGDPILANNVSSPEGALAGGSTIYADSVILDYGKNYGGYHEVTTVDGLYGANSPYSQVVSWTLHPKNATLRTRQGNLVGVFGVTGEYGLFAGTGTAASDQYIRAGSSGIILNNTPLQLFASGTQRVNIDATGTDVWFSSDGGTTKQLAWNGNALTFRNATAVFASTATMMLSASGIFATTAAGAPSFTTVTGTTSVNGESLSTGSTLMGDNSSGKGNVLFDQSAGTLRIRAGINDYFSFGASGKFEGILALGTSGEIRQGTGTFGVNFTGFRLFLGSGGGAGTSGSGIIDMWNTNDISFRFDPGQGIIVRSGTTFSVDKSVNFQTSTGTRTGELYSYTDASTYQAIRLRAYSTNSAITPYAYMDAAQEGSTGKAYAIMQASKFTSPNSYATPTASANVYIDRNANRADFQTYASSTSEDVQIYGTVTNTTSAITFSADDFYFGSGTKHGFYIDHPHHPLTMTLSHTPLETDDLRTFYDGTVWCEADGTAMVIMPDWFTALNEQVRYQLTCVGGWAQVRVIECATPGVITGEHAFKIVEGYEGLRVDWQVTGKRRDAWARYRPFVAEQAKDESMWGKLMKAKARGRGEEFQWRREPARPGASQ